MIEITFPAHPFKIKKQNGKELIFDPFRKQWFVLTPEEWVRQNFLQYLVEVLSYPASLIAVEREIMVNNMRRRFDIVVFKNALPWMIVECKEMQVDLSEQVIGQILNYNTSLSATFLVITNGSKTFALEINSDNNQWLNHLPSFV